MDCFRPLTKLCPPVPIPERILGSTPLLQHPTYLQWTKEEESSILLLSGPPGLGKSALSSRLLGSAEDSPERGSIVYFSFDGEDSHLNSEAPFLTSAIRQMLLLRPSLFASMRNDYKIMAENSRWAKDDLWTFFRSLLRSLDTNFTFFVNAIQDCRKENQQFVAKLFDLPLLQGLCARLRFVCTSTWQSIACPVPRHFFEIELREISGDLEAFIQNQISRLFRRMPVLQEFRDEITAKLLESKDLFQATLLLKQIPVALDVSTPDAIRAHLQSLRPNLDELVETILSRSLPRPTWIALSWVLHAARPLKPGELAVMSAMRDEIRTFKELDDLIPRDIVNDFCRAFEPLIKLQNGAIRLSHGLVRRAILRKASKFPYFDGSPSLFGHWEITKFCLDYLSTEEVKQWAMHDPPNSKNHSKSSRAMALLDYALNYWAEHYRQIPHTLSNSQYILEILKDKSRIAIWSGLSSAFENPVTRKEFCPMKPLHIATNLGLSDVVKAISSSSATYDLDSCDFSFALELASKRGDVAMITHLLDTGVIDSRSILRAMTESCARGIDSVVETSIRELERKGNYNIGWPSSLLAVASRNGHLPTVRILVKAGAPIDEKWEGSIPLLHATSEGHTEIVELFLRHGTDVNASNVSGATPLHVACQKRYSHIVNVILSLSKNVAVDTLDGAGFTALHLASERGYQEIVKLVLAHGVNVNKADRSGCTPLLLASRERHCEVVQLLLDRVAKVDVPDDHGRTALCYVSKLGDDAMARILLNAGASPNAVDDEDGWAPIHHAASRGNFETLNLLVAEGADINLFTRNHRRSVLHLAAQSESENTVKILLDAGANIEATDEYGITALHLAARSDSKETVLILLDRGAKVDATDYSDFTALHAATESARVDIMKTLVARGATVDHGDQFMNTPLCLASKMGIAEATEVLLKSGADPLWTDYEGNTPLHIAAYNGENDVIKTLVEVGKVDVNLRSSDGVPPISCAYWRNETVEYLLDLGAKPNIAAKDGTTALMVMADEGDTNSLQVLLARGTDVNAVDKNGKSALHFAIKNGSLIAVEALLTAGANASASNYFGTTPLIQAAQTGDLDIVKRLLVARSTIDSAGIHDKTALQTAILCDHCEVAELLLEQNAATDLQDVDGNTALHTAVRTAALWNPKTVTNSLLKKDAKLEISNNKGQTPLLVAASYANDEIFTLLLNFGAKVEAQDAYLSNVFHIASEIYTGRILELLISNQSTCILFPKFLRMQDIQGRLPIHCAASKCRPERVKTLLEQGSPWQEDRDKQGRTLIHHAVPHYEVSSLVDLVSNSLKIRGRQPKELNDPDADGWTPLHWACKTGNSGVVKLLLAAGASPVEECRRKWTPRLIAIFHNHQDLLALLKPRKDDVGGSGSSQEEGDQQVGNSVAISPVMRVPSTLSPTALSGEEDLEAGVRRDGTCFGCNSVSFSLLVRILCSFTDVLFD